MTNCYLLNLFLSKIIGLIKHILRWAYPYGGSATVLDHFKNDDMTKMYTIGR